MSSLEPLRHRHAAALKAPRAFRPRRNTPDRPIVHAVVALPCRTNRTPGVLVLALLAGLVAMHGLTGTASAANKPQARPAVMVMVMDVSAGHAARGATPAAPAPHGPHHGPAATGHHPCLVVPAAGAELDAPAASALAPAAPAPAMVAAAFRTAARADRAPPDLNRLCISRT